MSDTNNKTFCARCSTAVETMARPGDVANLILQRDKYLAVLIWIRDVVKERKGTAHWLQMVEDKTRAAIEGRL